MKYLPMSEKKPRKKLSILEWIVVGAMLLVFVVIGFLAIYGWASEHRRIEELKGARLIYFAMQQMAKDGKATDNMALGWPADTGIHSAADLKSRLLKGQYCTERDLRNWHYESFQIGNVSQSDPAGTICLRSLTDGGAVRFFMGGYGSSAKDSEKGSDPPRTPAYLPATTQP